MIARGDKMVCLRCFRTNRVAVNRWGDTFWNFTASVHCPDCHGTGWEPKDIKKAEMESVNG